MTTITLPRALIEQALEALRAMNPYPASKEDQRASALAALLAVLAQPDPQDPELSAALGWPGGISDPVLDRKTLLQMVAALMRDKLWEDHRVKHLWDQAQEQAEPTQKSLPCPTPTSCREHCCGGWCIPRAALAQQAEPVQDQRCRAEPRSDGDFVCDCKIGECPGRSAEPAQEPVAWSGYDLDGMVEAFSRVIEAHYQRANPFQHPIDMDAQMALRVLRGFIPAMKAYTAPPQRKPLPKHDQHCVDVPGYGLTAVRLVRAVERAHGIKE